MQDLEVFQPRRAILISLVVQEYADLALCKLLSFGVDERRESKKTGRLSINWEVGVQVLRLVILLQGCYVYSIL